MKPIAAFLPAMLLLLVGMRFFGLITIRNSSTDYENISRILKSPDPKFTDLIEIYQYEYNFFNLIVLLAALIIILIICINIRNGTIRKCIRKLRKRFGRKKLPDFSTVLNQATSFIKGLQYGQLSDVKRRYRVIMSICGNHQTSSSFILSRSETISASLILSEPFIRAVNGDGAYAGAVCEIMGKSGAFKGFISNALTGVFGLLLI